MADKGLSAQEREAVKQRAAELKAEERRAKGAKKAEADAADVAAKIAKMADEDRVIAQRVHEIVATVAPELAPKLYYGQPGYARDGKVLCFFRSGRGDKERYSTLGFSANANLDDSSGLWPTSYALIDPTDEAYEQVAALVARAVR